MENSIAKRVRSCMWAFQLLSAAVLEASEQSNHSLGDMSPEWAKDMFDRFKLWSQNIGAHHTGTNSLDYRLRDASNLRKQAIDLVGDLAQALEDATAIISGVRVPWDMEQTKEDLSSDSMSLSSASEDDETSLAVDSELTQIMVDIIDIIDCLLRLSVSVQNPAPHDRFKAATATNSSAYEATDIEHVRAKFNSAEKWLVERLGKAISHRRQYFKYRNAHHQKLASGLEDPETEIFVAESTVASSIPQHLKTTKTTMGDVASFGVYEEDQRSDTGHYSQISYTTSTETSEQLSMPNIPEAHRRGDFECPFCFTIISVPTDYAWKKHVFADLKPYICLEKDCEIPHEEYSRRHHWFGHLEQAHWRVWSCPFACEGEITSAGALKAHLVETHFQNLLANDVEKLVQMGARKVAQVSEATCPLCQETLLSAEKYMRHVGRHQEDLALFALPKLEVPDEHRQNEDGFTSGKLVSEHGELRGESQSFDEDEYAQESLEYPSQNDESSSVDLSSRSSAAPPALNTHTMPDITTTELYDTELFGSDDDDEYLRSRNPEMSAGHGKHKYQQTLEQRNKEDEGHPWGDDGSVGRSHHRHRRGRPGDESNMPHSHSPSRAGSSAYPTVEPNETEPNLNKPQRQLESEEQHSRRLREQLHKRSGEQEVNQQKDRLKGRFERSETSIDPPERSRSKAPRSSRVMSHVSYADRPYVEPLGPHAARPTGATQISPNVVSPGRRFGGPVAVSKTSQPAISHYQDPAYSSVPRSAGMERATVLYTYDGVRSPSAVYQDGNYYPHPLDKAPDQSQRAQQPTGIDEPADNDREKRHNAVPYYQDPPYSSASRSTGKERPTVFYNYDGAMSPSAGYESGNYYPHPLGQAPSQSQWAQQPTSSGQSAGEGHDYNRERDPDHSQGRDKDRGGRHVDNVPRGTDPDEIDTKPCKFWAKGMCSKGDSCTFRHD